VGGRFQVWLHANEGNDVVCYRAHNASSPLPDRGILHLLGETFDLLDKKEQRIDPSALVVQLHGAASLGGQKDPCSFYNKLTDDVATKLKSFESHFTGKFDRSADFTGRSAAAGAALQKACMCVCVVL
jgi:hypothetical protein